MIERCAASRRRRDSRNRSGRGTAAGASTASWRSGRSSSTAASPGRRCTLSASSLSKRVSHLLFSLHGVTLFTADVQVFEVDTPRDELQNPRVRDQMAAAQLDVLDLRASSAQSLQPPVRQLIAVVQNHAFDSVTERRRSPAERSSDALKKTYGQTM